MAERDGLTVKIPLEDAIMTVVVLRELPPCPNCGSTEGSVGWHPDRDPEWEIRDCACGYETGWRPVVDGKLTVLRGADTT